MIRDRIWNVEPFTFRPKDEIAINPLWQKYFQYQAILQASGLELPRLCAAINDDDFGALMWQLGKHIECSFDGFKSGIQLPFGVSTALLDGVRESVVKDGSTLVMTGGAKTSIHSAKIESLDSCSGYEYWVDRFDSPDFAGFVFADHVTKALLRLRSLYAAEFKDSIKIS